MPSWVEAKVPSTDGVSDFSAKRRKGSGLGVRLVRRAGELAALRCEAVRRSRRAEAGRKKEEEVATARRRGESWTIVGRWDGRGRGSMGRVKRLVECKERLEGEEEGGNASTSPSKKIKGKVE